VRYISRSSFDTFRECPRKGYWRYLSGPYEGGLTKGLEESGPPNPHYTLGIVWHLGAEVLLKGGSGEEAFDAAKESPLFAELDPLWWQWLLAAYLAWERVKRDDFLQQYDVLEVEEEFEIPISPNVMLYTRADAVVRDRSDGSNWVLNWKTTSDVKDWTRKWFYDPQGWTEAIAAEGRLNIPISGCIYVGVWKGPFYQGKTTSRLIFGYKTYTKGGAVTYGTETNGGASKFAAWQETFPFGEGLSAWISWLDKGFLSKYFVESAPQLRQDELVAKWLKQLVRQENEIDYVLEAGDAEEQEAFFWQNWGEECGRCPFKDLCRGLATPETLIEQGFLKPRRRSPRDEAEAKAAAGQVP
jgi:hypothetical protein